MSLIVWLECRDSLKKNKVFIKQVKNTRDFSHEMN